MPKLKLVLTVIFVLILVFRASSGQTAAAGRDTHGDTTRVVKGYSRRFLTDVLDYDYGGPNSKHDPRKKPGNGH